MQVEKNNVTREVVTEVVDEVFVITLSRDEASALQALLGSVGGHLDVDNLRNVTDSIYSELSKVGIDYFKEDVQKYARHVKANAEVGL